MSAHTAVLRSIADHGGPFLQLGPVDTLLDHDPGDAIVGAEPRLVDRCIKKVLLTDSDIHVVPNVDVLDDGVAALLGW